MGVKKFRLGEDEGVVTLVPKKTLINTQQKQGDKQLIM